MKKAVLIIALTLPLCTKAQVFQGNVPWNQSNQTSFNRGSVKLSDVTHLAENYFRSIDKNKKGSGYKPFKRWEYHWSYYTKQNGTSRNATDLVTAWNQKREMTLYQKGRDYNTSNWISFGPYTHSNNGSWTPGKGRVNVIAVDPKNENTYYVGTPAGGLWKSIDQGFDWTPLTDHLPQIGVSGIAIDSQNTNIIYIATGDDDGNDSYCIGVLKSTDGGSTWNHTGQIEATSMSDIIVHPIDTNIVLVATNTGVYKSTNSGESWSKVLDGNIRELKIKPTFPDTWYAASNQSIYKSTNTGGSFVKIKELNSSSRIALAVSEANPNFIYFVSANQSKDFNGVYKSTNSGQTFQKTNETSDLFNGSKQSYYDLAITASDTNEDEVYVGVLNIWKSSDQGEVFTQINKWNNKNSSSYTHADIHFLQFFNGNLFAGTDGGIYRSNNNGASFDNLNDNLAISQFYKISVSAQQSNKIVGGIQDNGGYAMNGNSWNNYFGADGMDCAINTTDPNKYYGFIQFGKVLYHSTDGGQSLVNSTAIPNEEKEKYGPGGNWVTPLVSNNEGVLYAGYSQLYKLVDKKWEKVSNHPFDGNIDLIKIDPVNNQIIYVTKKNNLFKSEDGGVNFIKIATISQKINSIEINSNNPNIAWIVTNDSVYKTDNLKVSNPTFINITSNLPSESKLVIKHHKNSENNTIYLGTSLGVYYTNDVLNTWKIFDNNLPNVAVTDLEIQEDQSLLYAATFGRGVFVTETQKKIPTIDLAVVGVNLFDKPIQCDVVIEPVVTVKNNGLNEIQHVVFKYSVNPDDVNTFEWNGSISSDTEIEITLPTKQLAIGSYNFKVEIIVANDNNPYNNILSNKIIVNKLNRTPNEVITFEDPEDEFYSESFENENTIWSIQNIDHTLFKSDSRVNNKVYVATFSTNSQQTLVNYLYTNCYNLKRLETPTLKFKMGFDLPSQAYINVEYSTNYGQSWHILGTMNDSNWYNNNSNQNNMPGNQWTGRGRQEHADGGTNAGLREYSYDVSSIDSSNPTIFRYKVNAENETTDGGVYIDDFVIDGAIRNSESLANVAVYPNPSDGVFNFEWDEGEIQSIKIFNLSGKLLLEREIQNSNQHFCSLELSQLNKGVYVAKLFFDNKHIVKKLIMGANP